MTPDTFGIPMAFVIIAALTLWVVLGSKGHWLLKMGMVSVSIFFSILLWNSLVSLQGYPAATQMPEQFEIKWLDVQEPNMKTGDPGQICVWARDISPKPAEEIKLHTKEMSGDPRVYEIPYSRKMHEQAQQIKQMIAQGGKFYGRMGKEGEMGEAGKGEGKGKGKGGKGKGSKGIGKGKAGKGGEGSFSRDDRDPMFYELPPPVFPEKDVLDDPEAGPSLGFQGYQRPSGVAP